MAALKSKWVSLVTQMVKIPLECGRPGFDPWVGNLPWRRARQPTPIFLPGESSWTEEPGQLQFMGSQRVRNDQETKHTAQKASMEINYFVFKTNFKLTQYHLLENQTLSTIWYCHICHKATKLGALSGFSSSLSTPENTGLQFEWFPWSLSHWAWIKVDIFYSRYLQHWGNRRRNNTLDSFKRLSLNLLYIKWVLN